mgnify:CR=1 FL=1
MMTRFLTKIIKLFILLIVLTALTGCVELLEVALDIIADHPVPVCDAESVGARVAGESCVKLSDGTYEWMPE